MHVENYQPSRAEIRDGKLVHDNVGATAANLSIGGKGYKVKGDTLTE